MIGFHYTTKTAWESIKVQGLIPKILVDSPFSSITYVKIPDKIIWLFSEPPIDELGLRGQVIFTLVKGNILEDYIVELGVEYSKRDLAPCYKDLPHGDKLYISHTGSLGIDIGYNGVVKDKDYHTEKPSILLTRPIRPANISLLRMWQVIAPVSTKGK